MNNNSLTPSLFSEKNLSALLKVFEDAFPKPLASKALGAWSGFVSFFFLIAVWHFRGIDGKVLQESASLMASYSLTVSSALMGVVIAGMSIFATSLKPKVANGLIETTYPGTDVSSLKFIFAMFAYLLFSLLVVVIACGVFYFVLADKALLLTAFRRFVEPSFNLDILNFCLISYVSVLLGLTVFLGSLLKSFIWNLHQVLLVVAVFNGRTNNES